MRINVRKSASFQECRHLSSATSDVSTSSSTSEGSDTPLRKSAGGSSSSHGLEEASDGSDADRPRRHLRVPSTVYPGQGKSLSYRCDVKDTPMKMESDVIMHPMTLPSSGKVKWSLRRDSLPVVNLRKAWLSSRRNNSPGDFRRGSTGNFSPSAGGGGGAPRSAPATPVQLEPQARATKHDKHVVKPLSGSAPSVRVGIAGSDDTTECKQPSKSRQKKFQRHFPQVGPEERVLNYYSCALVGDILLQGHLYITKNYFAFYSNVFGYVTKLLIPTSSVLRITKEKVARIIPNAVGVCTRDERHVFGSLLSRDATYKLMTLVWKSSKAPELAVPKSQDLRTPEVSEYSPEDDSSSGGADHVDSTQPARPEPEAIMAAASAAVIQPALLTGTTVLKRDTSFWHMALLALAALLTCSAMFFSYRLYCVTYRPHEWATSVSSEELYSELVRWRTRLHGRAANELHAFLSTNLLLLTKVRQSLEALSGVILTDMAEQGHRYGDVPNDTLFS